MLYYELINVKKIFNYHLLSYSLCYKKNLKRFLFLKKNFCFSFLIYEFCYIFYEHIWSETKLFNKQNSEAKDQI